MSRNLFYNKSNFTLVSINKNPYQFKIFEINGCFFI